MPKQTRKYKTACELGDRLNILERDNQEKLYRLLNEASYFWEAGSQAWQHLDQDADRPTELIRVRVWAESSKVEGAAYQVRLGLEEQGYIFFREIRSLPLPTAKTT